MERRIDLHLCVSYEPCVLRPWLVLCLLVLSAGELGSESVTLTTYYPAPSGVYTQMITTGQTLLARDGGSVGIGTSSPPGNPVNKLDVNGGISIEGKHAFRGNDSWLRLNESGAFTSGVRTPGDLYVERNILVSGSSGCFPQSTEDGICAGGYATYATWLPGVYGLYADDTVWWATGPKVTIGETATPLGPQVFLTMESPQYYCCAK